MSGSPENSSVVTATDELRRRFAVWTLAIVGTLSGSGAVQLRSQLWAAEDPPAGLPQDANQAPAEPEAPSDPAQLTLNRETLQQLIADQEFEQAKTLVTAALAGETTDEQFYLSTSLAGALSRQSPEEAQDLYKAIVDRASARIDEKSSGQLISSFVLSVQGLSKLQDDAGHVDAAIATLQTAIDRMASSTQTLPMSHALPVTLAQLLVEHDRASEARTLLVEKIDQAQTELAQQATPANRQRLATAVSNFARILGEDLPDEAHKHIAQVQPQLLVRLKIKKPVSMITAPINRCN